jgi:CO/xanthine dehydrogenase Mo-binding subunit
MLEQRSVGGAAVGERWARTDGRAKVRGELRYAADQPVRPCLDVAIQRSTRPHALITSIDTSRARAADGVVAVITGADLYAVLGDRLLTGPAFADQPCLAVDKVRYVGEPVAVVIAHGLAEARAAADEIEVEYDELEPVHDVAAAIAGNAFVHDELRPSSVFGDLRHLRGKRDTNVNYEFNLRRGDPETRGTVTVRDEFWCPPTHHVPIELPYTAAWCDGDRLEMLSTTQTPSYVRQALADLLDLPLNRVRVRTAPLGGSFGAKMYDRLEPLAAALAWTQRMPVRIAVTREEAFLLTTRHGAAVTGSMSADDDGTIVSATADVRYDTGAYADIGPRITAKSGMVAAGPYRVDNVGVRSRCLYTNKPSAGPFRGFGVPQVTWAHESLVDELARARGEDPAAFRRRNLLREGDLSATGTPMHSGGGLGIAAGPPGGLAAARPWCRGGSEGCAHADHLQRDTTAQPGRVRDTADQYRGHGPGQRHDHGADRGRGAVPVRGPGPGGLRGHRRDALRHDHRGQPVDLPHRQRGPTGRGGHAGAAGRARGRAVHGGRDGHQADR